MADRPTDHARAEAAFAEFRRTGSPRAMAEVFDRTAAGLLLFARRFARDAAAAEDLVQQTFLRAIERAATFAPDRQLMPWLTAILANEARMELRRRRTPDPGRLRPTASEDPGHAAERREAAAAMDAALAELPPTYRDVVALRYLHDTRPGRIAEALAVPLPTVKTRLNRGVRKLAAALPRGLGFGAAVALCAGRG
ncbi:MAG: sigma-70 family RNA polymerase sigma factor, partial [Planctomycetota bacterium]